MPRSQVGAAESVNRPRSAADALRIVAPISRTGAGAGIAGVALLSVSCGAVATL